MTLLTPSEYIAVYAQVRAIVEGFLTLKGDAAGNQDLIAKEIIAAAMRAGQCYAKTLDAEARPAKSSKGKTLGGGVKS